MPRSGMRIDGLPLSTWGGRLGRYEAREQIAPIQDELITGHGRIGSVVVSVAPSVLPSTRRVRIELEHATPVALLEALDALRAALCDGEVERPAPGARGARISPPSTPAPATGRPRARSTWISPSSRTRSDRSA